MKQIISVLKRTNGIERFLLVVSLLAGGLMFYGVYDVVSAHGSWLWTAMHGFFGIIFLWYVLTIWRIAKNRPQLP